MLKLYNISDNYVEYLRAEHEHVYSNKDGCRTHERKYIGTVLEINGYNYYIPLSSPKADDYEFKDGSMCIKNDSFIVWYIKDSSRTPVELKASIHFEDMIPVPESEIELYNVDEETDINYKALISKEVYYIRKKENDIIKRAKVIYRNKTKGNTQPVYAGCLDFKDLERMHNVWVENIKQE